MRIFLNFAANRCTEKKSNKKYDYKKIIFHLFEVILYYLLNLMIIIGIQTDISGEILSDFPKATDKSFM